MSSKSLVDEKDIVLEPGACFGWFSNVASDCHPSSCARSEWCRTYTISRANESEQSMKKDIDELGQEEKVIPNTPQEKKAKNKEMAELGKQAFFDHCVNAAAGLIKHDSIKYNPGRTTASLKIGGRVMSFLAKKRNFVYFEIGGRNKGGPSMNINMGSDDKHIKELIKPFVEQHYK